MLNIIHLSDLHIKENIIISDLLIESLNNAISCEINDEDMTCVLCSGDIAYSGNTSEYDIAEIFFKKLLKNKLENASLILSPGNHDNNFSEDTSVRESVIKDIISQYKATEPQIEECLKTQINYNNFKNKIETIQPVTEKLLNKSYQINYKEKMITINSINSAYCCEKNCSEGSIFIPIEFLDSNNIYSDYKIAIFHHTPNWFLSTKQREIRATLLKNYDIVFLGHEHEVSNYTLKVQQKLSTDFIEGGIINLTAENESSFNLIQIDFDNDKLIIKRYKYDLNSAIFRIDEENTIELSDSKYTRQYSELKPDFAKFLDDPGATYNHPRKTELILNDIYVFPNLKNTNKTEYTTSNDISSKKIIQEQLGKIVISGDDKSGKTSFAKVLFSEYLTKGMFPVYIDCKSTTKNQVTNINSFIINNYKKQYNIIDEDKFKQNRKCKTIPIVDNFDQIKHNSLEQLNIIHELNKNYDNFLILTGDPFLLEELARIEDNNTKFTLKVIPSLNSYQLKPLGHLLRGELLKKWFDISDEQIDFEESRTKIYDTYMNILNKIVSYNYVPPYPIYLLTALSAASSKIIGDVSASSYGHYYQALITLALARVNDCPAEIDLKMTFLSELSFYLFMLSSSCLTNEQLHVFINEYNTKYDTSIQKDFISDLIKANVLYKEGNNIYFKYRYIHYYFVALYISQNLHEDDKARNSITTLINSLYKESYSSILLILISLSKDSLIINQLNNYAKSLFMNSPIANISNDTEHFNQLVSHVFKLVIPEASPSVSRKESEKFQDSYDNTEINYKGTDLEINEDEQIDIFTQQISATIRCVDIIGQALKAHYGSLRTNQKDPLFSEGIKISLRALGDFYSFMKSNTSMWLKDIEDEISKRKTFNKTEIEQISKKILMQLSAMISFFFITLPTRAFASENLMKTFETYFSKEEKTNANELLDFYLELESTKQINFLKFENLINNLKDNVIGFSVLQQIMANFLYMNKTDFRTKNKISSMLNISMKKQVLIDIESENKNIR